MEWEWKKLDKWTYAYKPKSSERIYVHFQLGDDKDCIPEACFCIDRYVHNEMYAPPNSVIHYEMFHQLDNDEAMKWVEKNTYKIFNEYLDTEINDLKKFYKYFS